MEKIWNDIVQFVQGTAWPAIKGVLIIAVDWLKSTLAPVDAFLNANLMPVLAPVQSLYEGTPLVNYLSFIRLLTIVAILLVLIIFFGIIGLIVKPLKKRKVKFIVDGKVYAKTVAKYKKPIDFPADPVKAGYHFVGWYKNKKLTKSAYLVLKKKKNIKLYAKFEAVKEVIAPAEEYKEPVNEVVAPVEAPVAPAPVQEVKPVVEPQVVEPKVVEPQPAVQPQPVEQPVYQQPVQSQYVQPAQPVYAPAQVVEELIEAPVVKGLGDFYDEIRFAMLGYERAPQFKKLGVQRKQIVAEMFERNGAINLYLAVDPALMQEKGYNVTRYSEPEFAIVPCKKTVSNEQELAEALELIKEAMLLNNLVKSDLVFNQKTVSNEQTRKSGFAFFVKNETVATTADDYYRLLRAVVLSYQMSPARKLPDNLENKMILKIFKKEEQIYLYLALNAEESGLEFVGYDKNFADTPAMFAVNTAEDCRKANELIDKLMYRFGMEKHPEKAEISLEDTIDRNCGFGYRIRH